jgi:cysteine-rich CPXCG protein
MQFAHDDDSIEDPLDRDFPLGDGTADTDASVVCPYCAESVSVALDPGSGSSQDYVEDCPVCCQPWQVSVRYSSDGTADVSVAAI